MWQLVKHFVKMTSAKVPLEAVLEPFTISQIYFLVRLEILGFQIFVFFSSALRTRMILSRACTSTEAQQSVALKSIKLHQISHIHRYHAAKCAWFFAWGSKTTHPSTKFCNNLSCWFCVTLLTNKRIRPNGPLVKPNLNSLDLDFCLYLHQISHT